MNRLRCPRCQGERLQDLGHHNRTPIAPLVADGQKAKVYSTKLYGCLNPECRCEFSPTVEMLQGTA